MKTRKLKDIEVSAVGMGCMAFSHATEKSQVNNDDGFIRGWGLSQVDVDVIDAALGVFQLSEPAQLNTDR